MAQPRWDLAIIGSGFGGSVCALRAAQAGLCVIVLERGRRVTPQLHADMAEGRLPFRHLSDAPGLIEWAGVGGLGALVGSAVGGGSHVYTAATVPARPEVFRSGPWPSTLSGDRMGELYRRVAEVIRPTPVPIALPRTVALERIGAKMGSPTVRLPLAMDWPADPAMLLANPPTIEPREELSVWLQGGHAARKRTLDKTYLFRAEQAGAEVRPLCEVAALAPEAGGYRVVYRRFDDGYWSDESLWARRVVVAAGTINTVRLLLTCRDQYKTLPHLSERLGDGFFTNGDFGAVLRGPRGVDARDSGPPVTAWLDCWESDRLYLMELGLLPPLPGIFAWGAQALFGGGHAPLGGSTPAWAFGVMGFDDSPGRLVADSRGGLRYLRPESNGPFGACVIRRLRELADAAGAVLVAAPESVARNMPVTVHPLGGAAMANAPDCGVVDSAGQMFGYPGLFVADGSLLPVPTGAAPSMTIAALAEHVAEGLTNQSPQLPPRIVE